ncbi:MAG: TolC family protein [Planctomycetaceae bacterium]|nr:TolC family protein [Planctomycetaceae bacterium]
MSKIPENPTRADFGTVSQISGQTERRATTSVSRWASALLCVVCLGAWCFLNSPIRLTASSQTVSSTPTAIQLMVPGTSGSEQTENQPRVVPENDQPWPGLQIISRQDMPADGFHIQPRGTTPDANSSDRLMKRPPTADSFGGSKSVFTTPTLRVRAPVRTASASSNDESQTASALMPFQLPSAGDVTAQDSLESRPALPPLPTLGEPEQDLRAAVPTPVTPPTGTVPPAGTVLTPSPFPALPNSSAGSSVDDGKTPEPGNIGSQDVSDSVLPQSGARTPAPAAPMLITPRVIHNPPTTSGPVPETQPPAASAVPEIPVSDAPSRPDVPAAAEESAPAVNSLPLQSSQEVLGSPTPLIEITPTVPGMQFQQAVPLVQPEQFQQPIEQIPVEEIPHGGHSMSMPAPDQLFSPAVGGPMVGAGSLCGPASGSGVGGHSFFGAYPGTSGYRANTECDGNQLMGPYHGRAGRAQELGLSSVMTPRLADLPVGFRPWWDEYVRRSNGLGQSCMPVDVSLLLQDAMLYSPQVVAIQVEPEVKYKVVVQESAKFDWTAFMTATYDDLNDPVGNTLTTGNGEDRLLTRNVYGFGGLRQKNLHGGEFRVAQNLGHENQNSRFFVPNNQATTRLEVSYRQPLLDGAGRPYNESEIILARIQANASEDEVVDALQDHLIQVTEAYWTLYRARSEFCQRQKLLTSAQRVLETLEGRNQVDTIPRQVLRARAAVARAQTRIQRTLARVKDAEAQLRLLVNSPGMLDGGPTELMPTESPSMVTECADLQSVLQTALINRPDISEAIRQMRASSVRLGVSRNELLPRLDFLVKSYVADLSGNSNLNRALKGQFGDNRPGYTVGMEFEVPLGNRAANAKYEQRQWELKRSINVFRATVEKSLTDVEIANREVATAWSEVLSRYQSMMASENETAYLKDRFEVLPMAEDSATLLLEDLLDSMERLADEEASFVQAQVDHAIALIKLKKELGILLTSRHARPAIDPGHQEWMHDRISSLMDGERGTQQEVVTASPTPAAVAGSGEGFSFHSALRNTSTAEPTQHRPGDQVAQPVMNPPEPAMNSQQGPLPISILPGEETLLQQQGLRP